MPLSAAYSTRSHSWLCGLKPALLIAGSSNERRPILFACLRDSAIYTNITGIDGSHKTLSRADKSPNLKQKKYIVQAKRARILKEQE